MESAVLLVGIYTHSTCVGLLVILLLYCSCVFCQVAAVSITGEADLEALTVQNASSPG